MKIKVIFNAATVSSYESLLTKHSNAHGGMIVSEYACQ